MIILSLQVAFPSLESLVLEAEKHGVYAAGDITCGRKIQIAVSVGQGVTAALSIIRSHVEARRKRKS